MEAVVFRESNEGQKVFIALETPELSGALQSPLILRTGGFNWTGTNRFTFGLGGFVIHAVFMVFKVADLLLQLFDLTVSESIRGFPE